jgi:hypothetical protein
MPITYGNQPNVTASEIAFSIYASVDSAFYDVEYPEYDWVRVLAQDQIKTDINVGALNYQYLTRDTHGAAGFVGNSPSDNIPMVSQSIGSSIFPLAASAVGAEITNEDARQYAMGMNGELAQDLGEVMRKACDNLIETSFFFGAESVGFRGFLNYAGVAIQGAAATGIGGATQWAQKTAEQMVQDVNNSITYMWESTRGVMCPGHVYLPMAQFAALSNTPMVLGGTVLAQSAIEYLKANNTFTAVRGRPLEIVSIRYLAGAGAAGVDRMVVMDRNKRNQCLPFPMPYTLSQPIPAALSVKLFSEQKHGTFAVRQPMSMLYVDGI